MCRQFPNNPEIILSQGPKGIEICGIISGTSTGTARHMCPNVKGLSALTAWEREPSDDVLLLTDPQTHRHPIL